MLYVSSFVRVDMCQYEDENYQVYLDERKMLIYAERETAQQFDKAVLTLAAGALALSITFIKHIAPNPKEESLWFLTAVWVCFSVSILSTLVSFLTSQAACRKYRHLLDSKSATLIPEAATATNVLNYSSIGFFIFGVLFLVFFTSVNIGG